MKYGEFQFVVLVRGPRKAAKRIRDAARDAIEACAVGQMNKRATRLHVTVSELLEPVAAGRSGR